MDARRAPLLAALDTAGRRRPADFGAPGHGSGRAVSSAARRRLGMAAFRADLLSPKGLDDRVESRQALQRAHELAAQAWGADLARFATGGTTESLHVLLAAVARPGESVILAVNAHKAEWSAAIYAGLRMIPLPVEVDRGWDLEHGPDPARLAALLDAHPEARAAVVVSPSYFGVTADVAALAEVCHARGRPLIVDAAWGAAFRFSDRLPPDPLSQGADAAAVSAHKTLAVLGQGSVLLARGGRVDLERLALAYELFQTTSPSVPVLASLDAARDQMERGGARAWSRVVDLAERARARLAEVEGVRLFGPEHLSGPGATALSPCVLTLDVSGLGICGFDADDWLAERRMVTPGLSDVRHLLFNFTQGATARDGVRLVRGVRALAAAARAGAFPKPPDIPGLAELEVELVMPPAEAFAAPAELVPFAQAEGRIAAEVLAPAPPGVPRLVPGQRIDAAHVRFFEAHRRARGFLMDPADAEAQRRVRVVRE